MIFHRTATTDFFFSCGPIPLLYYSSSVAANKKLIPDTLPAQLLLLPITHQFHPPFHFRQRKTKTKSKRWSRFIQKTDTERESTESCLFLLCHQIIPPDRIPSHCGFQLLNSSITLNKNPFLIPTFPTIYILKFQIASSSHSKAARVMHTTFPSVSVFFIQLGKLCQVLLHTNGKYQYSPPALIQMILAKLTVSLARLRQQWYSAE